MGEHETTWRNVTVGEPGPRVVMDVPPPEFITNGADHPVTISAEGCSPRTLAPRERVRIADMLDPRAINPLGLTDPAPAPRASRPRPGADRR
jgi:hypothetical protein